MRLSLHLIVTILFLAVFTSCGPESKKYTKSKSVSKPELSSSERELEAAKEKTRKAQQKLKEAEKDLERTKNDEARALGKKKQELADALANYEKERILHMTKYILSSIDIFENLKTKSKQDILSHIRKNQKSKSDILLNYFQSGQKPTNIQLGKLDKEELKNLYEDTDICMRYIVL